jgi:hypothetical protein
MHDLGRDAIANACGIAVMAKASNPGRTKTRLVPPLTFDEAASFNTAFLQDVAANILAAAELAPIRGYITYAPPSADSAAFFARILPASIGLIACAYPDFGECLSGAIDQLLQRGHGRAVVLNSDSPTLPTSLLCETAEALARPGERMVLGPSIDGGYYLLGVTALHRRLFENIAWSTEHVARQTMERAAEIGLEVHMLPAWYDVDDAESLFMLRAELYEGRVLATGLDRHRAEHSDRLMRVLLADTDLAGRLETASVRRFPRAAE